MNQNPATSSTSDSAAGEAAPRESVRRTIRYSGRVQGVGFRYTARETAAGFRVTGYVQNLEDGRVLLVVEGAADEVERFCSALATAMQRNITATDVDDERAAAKFSDFTIRH